MNIGVNKRSFSGFTLAELLIALAILGVIATFTIPKVLQANQNAKYGSIAKEAAGMVAGAYDAYKLNNGNSPSTTATFGDLTPYMNYVSVNTVGLVVDDIQQLGTATCGPGSNCLKLHNGAVLMYYGHNFNGSGKTNGLFFMVDPDGVATDATTNGPGKSVQIWLYYNGRMATKGTIEPSSCNSSTCGGPSPSNDPPWFSWN